MSAGAEVPATPAVPVGRFADVGPGLRVHYHEAGEGPPVVFVHGSGPGASGYSNFKQNYPHFARHGFRALVPDLLGFGYSSKPEDAEYGLDFLASGLTGFLDAVGVRSCALVGNSLGGALCIQLALQQPERVERLVLMAPGGLEPTERYFQMKGIRAMLRAVSAPEGITREAIRKVFSLQLHDPAGITDDVVEERYQVARLQPRRVWDTLRVPHLAPRLGELRGPVLALWGVDDQFCPVDGAFTLARSCRRTRVVTVSECGHWVMVERPDLFNRQVLDFLREGPDGP